MTTSREHTKAPLALITTLRGRLDRLAASDRFFVRMRELHDGEAVAVIDPWLAVQWRDLIE